MTPSTRLSAVAFECKSGRVRIQGGIAWFNVAQQTLGVFPFLRRIQTTQLRFRPNGPSVPIAWSGGPGLRTERRFSGPTGWPFGEHWTPGDELPTRWACKMGLVPFPWPAGPGYVNCWPFGPKHNNTSLNPGRPEYTSTSPLTEIHDQTLLELTIYLCREGERIRQAHSAM